jgi:hypothetical protein
MKWIIVKKRKESSGYNISLHPFVKNDPIYEFDSVEEAQAKLNEIENDYNDDIELSIILTTY